MSSNNNDDKSTKVDLIEKQNTKTKKRVSAIKKTDPIKQTEKDSIFSGSSNENENNNSFEENNKEQNDNNENNNIENKDIIDINDPNEKNSSKNENDDNNNINLLLNTNNISKEENQNISRSMSSKSNRSRSRSRSLSEKNSPNLNQNKNFDSQNQDKNKNNNGNKFKNYKNTRRPRNPSNNISINNNSSFIMKNGCCRNCMKAFSKNGKSCLCQVPRRERKFILPETGCNYCGCHGCNPIDMKYNKRLQQKNLLFQDNTLSHKNQRILDSEDEDLKINDDLVDYYNRDKRDIQDNLSDMLKINSIFYGFGVPLRIPSYILGYNPRYN